MMKTVVGLNVVLLPEALEGLGRDAKRRLRLRTSGPPSRLVLLHEVCVIRHLNPSARAGMRTHTHTHTAWQGVMSGRDDPPLVIAGRLVDAPVGYVVSDRNDPSLMTRVLKCF